jgi:hypothetical protein
MSEFSISGAFEKLRFPVLAMNCGCPDVEPVAAISLFLYTILLEPNKRKGKKKKKKAKASISISY